jgi:hypothetical protein
MITKIIFFITLLAYAILASQAFMYILSLKQVQLSLNASSYIELRKLTDTFMRANFKYVIYIVFFANLLLVFSTIKAPKSLLFVSATVAMVAFAIDIMLTLKGSLPINDIINSWSGNHFPTNWTTYRDRWFTIFQYRQIANIVGFLSLLTAAVFGVK